MSDELILGGSSSLIRPDAVENFGSSASIESGVRFYVRGQTVKPAGEEGEVTMRRLYINGYHTAAVALYVTPIVDGRWRNDLRAYLSKPATVSGLLERFSFIVPLIHTHADYPDIALGVRGNQFAAMLEMRDPAARIFIAALVFAHDPLGSLRARTPEEAAS